MHKVKCSECTKRYDYDEDGFCPYCGTFNQPPRDDGVEERRREGLSEAGHENSFLHAEFHEENRQRVRKGFDFIKETTRQTTAAAKQEKNTEKPNPLAILPWIIGGIILLDVFGNIFFFF